MTVIDVGANTGHFTVAFAAMTGATGEVIALEPDPENYAVLVANIWRAEASSVVPLCGAASYFTVSGVLSRSTTNRGDHRIFPHAGADETVPISVVHLDGVVTMGASVDVVKVDTHGSDHLVVRGMEGLIARQ